ncbi:alpha/beta fold hydrolase [Sporosarcina pasteurii]|uniref:Non-heme chloroperoxidase n=1 Tax=Sporosarcina pasteurii TaxID=1474 RepID=A0A380C4H8_SPOPA|nr:alpha/beta hydrolase [Sporosarcina pasteurii]MDS9471643.1 alpha/beta hydrolase [Sporosarcina pasteurii]QBQ04752.1 alpha/beta hydrolase [Sporosarcina pasteurii]SUJ11592.1 Non-heme chloroperoxidase [Sporosarcina pasteurii]
MPVINIDGVDVYYHVQGKGIPIVFIHPPLLTSMNFIYQVNELSQRFKVIVFDVRGHGNSSYSEKALTYPLISHDIKQLLDHLKIDKAFICGYSTGGSIALDFLLTYPKRSLGGILTGAMSEVMDPLLKTKITLGVKLTEWKALKALALSVSFTNANTRRLFKDLYIHAKRGKTQNVEQYYRYSLSYNCTDRLEQIKLPVLLLYGEKDKAFHRYAYLLQEKLPVNECILIGDVKHQLPTKAAVAVNNFITQFVSVHGH